MSKERWGIVLAGGSGTRLYPVTAAVSKQLLPIYNKPMVYYPLSVLMLAGIRRIVVISTPVDLPQYVQLLGDGSQFGIELYFAEQPLPEGIAQALLIAEQFTGANPVTLILGDNIFYGQGLSPKLRKAATQYDGATVFGYEVHDPERFSVASFDDNGRLVSIEEKPANPRSSCAVTGLYFFDGQAVEFAKSVRPSKRGELEIAAVNQCYLNRGNLNVEILGRGYTWIDTGTHSSLLEASMFIKTIQQQQGFEVACLEEIGWRNGWLTPKQLTNNIEGMPDTGYRRYLMGLLR